MSIRMLLERLTRRKARARGGGGRHCALDGRDESARRCTGQFRLFRAAQVQLIFPHNGHLIGAGANATFPTTYNRLLPFSVCSTSLGVHVLFRLDTARDDTPRDTAAN